MTQKGLWSPAHNHPKPMMQDLVFVFYVQVIQGFHCDLNSVF